MESNEYAPEEINLLDDNLKKETIMFNYHPPSILKNLSEKSKDRVVFRTYNRDYSHALYKGDLYSNSFGAGKSYNLQEKNFCEQDKKSLMNKLLGEEIQDS